MPTLEKVTLLTTASTYIRDGLPPTVEPYRRVAGLQVGQLPVVWSFDHKPDEDVTASTYNLHTIPAQRLLVYFVRHFSAGTTQYKADFSRNCFHFGVWMVRGLFFPSRHEATEMVFRNARYTSPATHKDNAPGRLSVIRPLQDLPDEPVLHGMIKLGDNDDYIQIMTRGGALGITTAADALEYRTTPAYREEVVRQCYSVDPVVWKVGQFSVSAALQPDY